jgi:hypothetical protein
MAWPRQIQAGLKAVVSCQQRRMNPLFGIPSLLPRVHWVVRTISAVADFDPGRAVMAIIGNGGWLAKWIMFHRNVQSMYVCRCYVTLSVPI